MTWLPSVWNACAISTPTTPPPMISSRSGSAFAVVASRLVHAPSIASRPSIGGIIGSEPVARITARRASSSSSPTVTRRVAGQPAVAADERDAARLQPRQLRVVVEVVDHLVAARQHRRDVEVVADRHAGIRLASASAS